MTEIHLSRPARHVALITIDNPPKMNAMTRPMLAELGRLWDELERDDSRCIVVTGAGGRAFSVGADVSGDLSAGRTVTFGAFNATIDTNGNNITYSNSVGNGGLGGLIKTGLGNLVLSSGANYRGTTQVSAGGLTIAGSLPTNIFNLQMSNSGPSSLTISNSTGVNFLQGGTTINQGTLLVNNSSGSGTGTGAGLARAPILQRSPG
jgi:autotransporter-associated beta strand protein